MSMRSLLVAMIVATPQSFTAARLAFFRLLNTTAISSSSLLIASSNREMLACFPTGGGMFLNVEIAFATVARISDHLLCEL